MGPGSGTGKFAWCGITGGLKGRAGRGARCGYPSRLIMGSPCMALLLRTCKALKKIIVIGMSSHTHLRETFSITNMK